MAQVPLIQGRSYSHSSAEIQIGTRIFTQISSIDWSQSLEPGVQRGTRPEKLSRTTGEYDAEGSFTMNLVEYDELIAELGDGYMGAVFDIVINFSDEGMPVTNIVLVGCRIKEESQSSESGGDPAEVEVPLDIMRIERNGLRAVPFALV